MSHVECYFEIRFLRSVCLIFMVSTHLAGLPASHGQHSTSRLIFADKIFLNMAIPLKNRLQKMANISNTEVYTFLIF